MQTRSMTRRNANAVNIFDTIMPPPVHTITISDYFASDPTYKVGIYDKHLLNKLKCKIKIKPYVSNTACSDLCMPVTIMPPPPKYEVNIDFDEAHDAWVANKRARPNSCYVYKCMAVTRTGKHCVRAVLPNIDYCRVHQANKPMPTTYAEVVDASTDCCVCGV